jgi:hypothetical protein
MSERQITFTPVNVHVLGQSEGRLAFVDETLVAVLVRLDDSHGELKGRWYAEAAFNSLERMEDSTFQTLDDAATWIRTWLDR